MAAFGMENQHDTLTLDIQILKNLDAHKYEILIFSLFLRILYEDFYSLQNILKFLNTISTSFPSIFWYYPTNKQ